MGSIDQSRSMTIAGDPKGFVGATSALFQWVALMTLCSLNDISMNVSAPAYDTATSFFDVA